MNKVYLKALGISFVVFLVLALAFKVWWDRSQTVSSQERLTSLDEMEKKGLPNFSAATIDKRTISLEQFKGKIVILNFWASWCAPCVEEMPSLIKLVKEFGGQIELIAVSGDNSLEDINAFLKSFPGLTHPNIHIIFDEDRKVMKLYGVDRLPESLVANKSHRLVKKIIGTIDWFTKDSVEYIKNIKE